MRKFPAISSYCSNLPIPIFIIILLGLGIYELQIGFTQWYYHILCGNIIGGWISGSFENPGPYGGFLAFVFPFALYVSLNQKTRPLSASNNRQKIFKRILLFLAWLNTIGILVLLPITQCRTAWLAIIISSIYIIGLNKIKSYWKSIRPQWQIVSLCTFCIILFIGELGIYQLKADSADGRLLIWKIALQPLTEYGLTGSGFGSFAKVYGDAQAHYFEQQTRPEREQMLVGAPEFCYNEYLQIGIEQGVVGLLIFLGFIFLAFKNIRHCQIWGAKAYGGALTSILVLACFSYPFRINSLLLLSIFIITTMLCFPIKNRNISTIITLCVTLIACYSLGIIGHPIHRQANEYWKKLQAYFYQGEFETISEKYALLYPYLSKEPSFLFEYGQCLSQTGQYEKSNEILEKGTHYSSDPMFFNIMGKNYQQLKQYDKAEYMFYQAIYRIPHKLYPYYLLMKMYIESNQIKKATEIAKTIIRKKLKVESIHTNKMKKEAQEFLSSAYQ